MAWLWRPLRRLREAVSRKSKLTPRPQERAPTGSLFDAEAVEREWSDIVRSVRSGLMALPSRVGARLLHLTPGDVAEVDVRFMRCFTHWPRPETPREARFSGRFQIGNHS